MHLDNAAKENSVIKSVRLIFLDIPARALLAAIQKY